MTERDEPPALGQPAEPTESSTSRVLEKHALDRILRAVVEDLRRRGLYEVRHAFDPAL